MKQIGLIGAGNMGEAILRGMVSGGYLKAAQITVCDASAARMEELAKNPLYKAITYCDNPADLVEACDLIVLAVKPGQLQSVLSDVQDVSTGKAFVSIVAGWTCSQLRQLLEPAGASYLRVMPNTPAMVGEGMTAICLEHTLSEEDFDFAKGIFDIIGKTVLLPEQMFDGAVALCGSSPAYVYMMIEAMADGGVRAGIPRKSAIEMAAQSVLGAALMVLSMDDHPASLKDAVCSPGGTTIEAVARLEACGFRAAILDAMVRCAEKSKEMGENRP